MKTKDSVKTNFNRLTGYLDNTANLVKIDFVCRELNWSAVKTAPFEKEKEKKDISKLNTVVPVSFLISFLKFEKLNKKHYCSKCHGLDERKRRNFTETDVLVKNGKFALETI
jgi:hypothetical protein